MLFRSGIWSNLDVRERSEVLNNTAALIDKNLEEEERRLDDREVRWLQQFQKTGKVENRISKNMFLNGDSREPEIAGVLGAVVGSLYTILITLLISFPIGVSTAIYLENFAV